MPSITIGSAAIGAGAKIYSSKKAAKASQQATDQSLALQKEMYDQTRSDLQPYTQGGYDALGALKGRLGLGDTTDQGAPNALKTGAYADPAAFSYGLGDYTASPAYQVQLQQGINAINSSAAARGSLNSGATLKALQKYGSDLALQDFGNERAYAANRYDTDRTYNAGRYDTQNSNLFALAQMGQSAVNGAASMGANYANGASKLFGANATAQGNAYNAQGDAFSTGVGQAGSVLKDANDRRKLNAFFNPSGWVSN